MSGATPDLSPRPSRAFTWAFAALLIAWGACAAQFIFQNVFFVDGQTHFTLFDDTMISMRYARNLASGHGLVWNAGEPPVEGITNPLWTLYMAGLHLLPIPAAWMSLPVQVSAVLCLLANLFVVQRIAETVFGRVVSLAAVALTAFYFPLNAWALMGTEVGALTLLYGVVVLRVLRAMQRGRADPWVHILLGLGTLLRIDACVGFVAVELFLLLFDPRRRAANLRWAAIAAVAFGGGQTLARWWYYGDWLPNTYYLKMTGFPVQWRLARGAYVLLRFMAEMHWVLFFAPFAVLLWRRERGVVLLAWAFLFQAVYSVYVGGDAWERHGGSNRYISIAMPFFCTLLAGSIASLWPVLRRPLPAEQAKTARVIFAHAGMAAAAVGCLWGLNGHYRRPPVERILMLHQPWAGADRELMVRMAKAVERVTRPDARIGVVFAGTLPYFCDRPMTDLLGKSDRHIAREPMHVYCGEPPEWMPVFLPGHLKWDYAYVLGQVRPDVLLDRWGYDEAALPADVRRRAHEYRNLEVGDGEAWFHVGSPRIRWERLGVKTLPPATAPTSF